MRYAIRLIFSVIFILGFNQFAFSAPVVTGYSNGQVSGTGFLSHPDNNEGDFQWNGRSPICAKFNDFETGEVESQGFYVENGNDAGEWLINNGMVNRNNSTYLAERVFAAARNYMLVYDQSDKSTGTLYVSFWVNFAGQVGDGKIVRWYFGPDTSRDNWYAAFTESGSLNTHSEASSSAGDYYDYTANSGIWYHYEIVSSYTGSGTGTFQLYVDGVFLGSQSDYFENAVFSPAGHGVQWGYISYPQDSSRHWYFDDLYADYTQARVMLCNDDTWQTTTQRHCEIQIPTAWSDTSITISQNHGSFNDGDTAYLYVVDENGDVNTNGYPITIGETPEFNSGALMPGSGHTAVGSGSFQRRQ